MTMAPERGSRCDLLQWQGFFVDQCEFVADREEVVTIQCCKFSEIPTESSRVYFLEGEEGCFPAAIASL